MFDIGVAGTDGSTEQLEAVVRPAVTAGRVGSGGQGANAGRVVKLAGVARRASQVAPAKSMKAGGFML